MGKSSTENLWNANLKVPVHTEVNPSPKAKVHSREFKKILAGDPVEINPSVGYGYKIMSLAEWSHRWKRNDVYPDCLNCGSKNTKEHHFIQTWCRGKKVWESETLCLDCHSFSWRSYKDPDFKTPEEYSRQQWEDMMNAPAGDANPIAVK